MRFRCKFTGPLCQIVSFGKSIVYFLIKSGSCLPLFLFIKFTKIIIEVLLNEFAFVLHDKPGMGKWNDLAE
jgi:hypothetical protein